MAYLPETPRFDDVYQMEATDPLLGHYDGTPGELNWAAQNLTNRTAYLKLRADISDTVKINLTVPDAASLRLIDASSDIGIALTQGASVKGDGGGGWWEWVADSTDTDNMGTVICPANHGVPGRWKRIYNGPLNVRWFGASPIATAAENNAAFQAALDATTNIGEISRTTTVHIPSGTYLLSTRIDVPSSACLWGDGEGSVLKPNNTDCLNFLESNGIAKRRIGNFFIYGSDTNSNIAINVDLDSPAGHRCTGLLFENLYIAFFGTGLYLRGIWNCTLRNVVTNHVHKGILLVDQCVKTLITDCSIDHGSLVSGVGNSEGVRVDTGVSKDGTIVYTHRPEDTWIVSSMIYGFDNAVSWRNALNGGIAGCDFDNSKKIAIVVTTATGGFVVRDCWIAVAPSNISDAAVGIRFVDLGYDEIYNHNILIENNSIQLYSSNENESFGILFGARNYDIWCNNNSLKCIYDNIKPNSIRIDGSYRIKLTNNTADTGLCLYTSKDCYIDGNHFDLGINLYAPPNNNTGSYWGRNTGLNTTFLIGDCIIPAGETVKVITFASLGLGNLPLYSKAHLTFNNATEENRGEIYGYVTQTEIKIIASVAFGVDCGISYGLSLYDN